jgi:hypothetical protein
MRIDRWAILSSCSRRLVTCHYGPSAGAPATPPLQSGTSLRMDLNISMLSDSGPRTPSIRDGHTSLYFGAAGMVWGLEYLGRTGATKARYDFRSVLPRLLEASQAEFAKWKYTAHGSLLLGDLGMALVLMRLPPFGTMMCCTHRLIRRFKLRCAWGGRATEQRDELASPIKKLTAHETAAAGLSSTEKPSSARRLTRRRRSK